MSNFVPQTEIVLCNHVPFDRSYEKTVLFDTKQEQQAFFNNRKVLEIPKNTYQRMSWSSFKVQAKADELREQGVNYCYWKNGNYSEKYYYAFVTSIEYVNPNTAIIYYELDVMQTYMFDLKWRESYFERKHYDLGVRNYDNYLASFTCPLIDEGLDYGNQYQIISRKNITQIEDVSFVICGTTADIGMKMVRHMPTGINYFIVPIYVGQNYYETKFKNDNTTLSTISEVIKAFRNNSELVGTLVSLTLVPFLPISTLTATFTYNSATDNYYTLSSAKYLTTVNYVLGGLKVLEMHQLEGFNYYDFKSIATIYQNFPNFSEQKLLMSPYCTNILSTDRGDNFVIKNEYLNCNNINVRLYGTLSSQNKQAFLINNYAGSGETYYLDNGIVDESNASMPIIDDYTASYIQSNANSISVARSNASNARNTAIMQATNNYNTNITQVGLSKQQAKNTQETAIANAGVTAVGDIATSLVQATLGGNSIDFNAGIEKAGTTLISGTTNFINSVNNASNNYKNAMLSAVSDEIGAVNSRANALLSANTDYQNTIATLNAKYQDAQMIADTARSMGNDFIFNCVSMHDGLYLYHKRIADKYAIQLTNYFRMYGYLANEMGSVTEAINSRELYNYVKLIQCNVVGDLPQDVLMQIKDIYMKGITFVHKLYRIQGSDNNFDFTYANIAYSFNDCLYESETNVPTKSTHTVIVGGGAYDSEVSYYTKGEYVKSTGATLTINARVADAYIGKYIFKGWLGLRLGVLYKGNSVTLPVYHDDTFYPILEQVG